MLTDGDAATMLHKKEKTTKNWGLEVSRNISSKSLVKQLPCLLGQDFSSPEPKAHR